LTMRAVKGGARLDMSMLFHGGNLPSCLFVSLRVSSCPPPVKSTASAVQRSSRPFFKKSSSPVLMLWQSASFRL
jgi:hypothetical protein